MRTAAAAVLAAIVLLLAGCASSAPPSTADDASAIVATIPVGPPPTLIAIAPSGTHLYAASSGSLAVIDTATAAVIATLGTSPNPAGIAVAPDGSRVYVTALFSVALTVLDTATDTLAPPIQLALQRFRGGYSWMALTPDGATAFIANTANNGLAVVPLPGGGGEILLPDVRPRDVAITPDGTTLYSAGCKRVCTPGYVQVFDVATRRSTAEIAVDGNPYRVAVAPDGARVYTTNLSGPSVSMIDAVARAVTATVPVATQPTGLAVSPDSRTVWVASQTGGMLTAIDAAAARVRATLPILQARDVVVAPDGRRVYVSADRAVVVVDPARLATAPGLPLP